MLKLKQKSKSNIELILKSNINLSSKKNSLSTKTLSNVEQIIFVLVQTFANARTNYLHLLFLTKKIITTNLTKIEKKKIVKLLNIIKESSNNTIIQIVNKYSLLLFLNSSLNKLSSNALLYVKTYICKKNLRTFLKKESHILLQLIDIKDENEFV